MDVVSGVEWLRGEGTYNRAVPLSSPSVFESENIGRGEGADPAKDSPPVGRQSLRRRSVTRAGEESSHTKCRAKDEEKKMVVVACASGSCRLESKKRNRDASRLMEVMVTLMGCAWRCLWEHGLPSIS
ncbi:hypothetical protein CDL15_Pgr016018 [Punica granatum]|uniref:Uncharacterized protein n=1 Tax=Punica granatum TaxID=22663 RepID=A0A218XR36_PUNGR|nr:hypothetical protein CDL15_Pgr016018 [Punica granatum]